jgi:hypothetical protein
MSDAVARVLNLFRQSCERGVTGVTHVTQPNVTALRSMVTPVTPVTPVTCLHSNRQTYYVSEQAAGAASHVHDLEERAAIAIYDGGMPESYAATFARLQIAQPIGVQHPQWLRGIDDAGRFLDRWARVAARLQWSAEDIFKYPATPMVKAGRLSLRNIGLCWLIGGRDVVALDFNSATIGNSRLFRRTPDRQMKVRADA